MNKQQEQRLYDLLELMIWDLYPNSPDLKRVMLNKLKGIFGK